MKILLVSFFIASSAISVNLPSGGTARITYEEKEPEVYTWVLFDSSNRYRYGIIKCGSGSVWEGKGEGKLVLIDNISNSDSPVIRKESPCLKGKFEKGGL
jgi:hypothetical protein